MLGLIQILGGLALFMYGIHLLSSGMEKLTGEQIQKWLDRVTSGRIKSFFFGAGATALIQSSGLLMVTMIGLINANLMSVEQAIGVMLGQEIGTTLTAQIVAFDISNFRMILVILGIVFLEFIPKNEWKKFGEITMGLGVIFVGMGFMSSALGLLIEIPWVDATLNAMGNYPIYGIIAGLLLTSLTQSSTAVTSMTVAMGISNVINLQGAVGIILGANIGSCITGLVASVKLSPAARQASMAQILINVIGVILFMPFITPYSSLIQKTSAELPRQIANAHTIFNVSVSLLMFPFVRNIAKISRFLIPAKAKEEVIKITAYIDENQFSVPAVALNEASRELVRLGNMTAEMVEASCMSLIEKDYTEAQRVLVLEDEFVDPLTNSIDLFVNKLFQQEISPSQQKRCLQIKSLLVDIERVGDLAEDIAQYAIERMEKNVPFSDQATTELIELTKHIHQTYLLSLQAFNDNDPVLAKKVCDRENEFDKMYRNTREGHILRLAQGVCHPEADVIFTETLRNMERISDHADNLGVSVYRTASRINPHN